MSFIQTAKAIGTIIVPHMQVSFCLLHLQDDTGQEHDNILDDDIS